MGGAILLTGSDDETKCTPPDKKSLRMADKPDKKEKEPDNPVDARTDTNKTRYHGKL